MDWFRANSLTLNVQKTKYLLFAPSNKKKTINLMIDNCIIKPSSNTKFLGVIVDDKLEWTQHVKNVLTKMKQNCSLMRLSRNLLSKHGLKTVYYAHIYSHMTYCISIWGSMTNANQLAKLIIQQNNCMRMLDKNMPLSQTYIKYKILKLVDVIDLELCKLGFKVYHDLLPVNLLASLKCDATVTTLAKSHQYNTRRKKEINLPMVTNRNYHRSFLFQGTKRYSSLSNEIKNITNYNRFVNVLKEEYCKQT